MIRCRASASATREVSIVIQRRPHCSATKAVVPEPQVGSSTRSPGSVDISMQRSTPWCRLHDVDLVGPSSGSPVSSQMLLSGNAGKSSRNRTYASVFLRPCTRRAARVVPCLARWSSTDSAVGGEDRAVDLTGNHDAAPSPLARPSALAREVVEPETCSSERLSSALQLAATSASVGQFNDLYSSAPAPPIALVMKSGRYLSTSMSFAYQRM